MLITKVINILVVISYLVCVVLIPRSWFEIEGKIIVTAIGYCSLFLGGLMVLLKVCLSLKKRKIKNSRDKAQSH